MKPLDYPTRVALRSFLSVEWSNRTLRSNEIGAGELEPSARMTALNSLINLGLVTPVNGGYTLTYEGIQEGEKLRKSWVDEPKRNSAQLSQETQ